MWEMIKRYFRHGLELTGHNGKNGSWPSYTLDESGLSEVSANGPGRKYLWSEVQHVGILTTADGPFSEDIFFIIKTDSQDICITDEQATRINLFDGFHHLPGFDYEQAAAAMCSTSEASFPCWDRSWGAGTATTLDSPRAH